MAKTNIKLKLLWILPRCMCYIPMVSGAHTDPPPRHALLCKHWFSPVMSAKRDTTRWLGSTLSSPYTA